MCMIFLCLFTVPWAREILGKWKCSIRYLECFVVLKVCCSFSNIESHIDGEETEYKHDIDAVGYFFCQAVIT
jgi:hypothetical protein